MAVLTRMYSNVGDRLTTGGSTGSDSPVYTTHRFTLTVDPSAFTAEEKGSGIPESITGITDKLPAISYKTGWDLSPVGTLTKKVEEFTQHKLIRGFAETNTDFRPPLFTDGWTQQMPKDGSTLCVDLSFRGYPVDGLYNATYYKKILQFMLYITTPREFTSTDAVDYINTGLAGANDKGRRLGNALNTVRGALGGNGGVMKFAEILSTSEEDLDAADRDRKRAFNEITDMIGEMYTMTDNETGGAPLCTLSIGNMIKAVPGVKWLVKNWAFKPARNVSYDEDSGLYDPIYVEFKVSLETQMVLTSDELGEILGFSG